MDPFFLTALIAGASYCIPAWLEWGAWTIVWKGLGVALLALWALRRTGRRDMAAVLAFGALGDVLLGIALTLGAGAFLIGHLIASWIYTRHRAGPWWLAPLSAAVIAACGYALSHSPTVALYAATLGLMAGSAIASSLPRQIAIGAVLFVLSDLLIFARLGPLAHSFLPTLLVWPLYFAGQTLIAMGAVTAFGRARVRV
jgi:uncharacterized membrane protein YhhN